MSLPSPRRHFDRNAVGLARRGKRTPATLLMLDERDSLIRRIAAEFYPQSSANDMAEKLRTELLNYRAGPWRRERSELTMPEHHRGKLKGSLWLMLKIADVVPSTRTIRRAMGTGGFRGQRSVLDFSDLDLEE